MQLTVYDVIVSPVITEKALRNQEACNQYTFQVHPAANKTQVKDAIEKIYNVIVKKIQVSTVRGKLKRVRHAYGKTTGWKKAVVRLKDGQRIDFV